MSLIPSTPAKINVSPKSENYFAHLQLWCFNRNSQLIRIELVLALSTFKSPLWRNSYSYLFEFGRIYFHWRSNYTSKCNLMLVKVMISFHEKSTLGTVVLFVSFFSACKQCWQVSRGTFAHILTSAFILYCQSTAWSARNFTKKDGSELAEFIAPSSVCKRGSEKCQLPAARLQKMDICFFHWSPSLTCIIAGPWISRKNALHHVKVMRVPRLILKFKIVY